MKRKIIKAVLLGLGLVGVVWAVSRDKSDMRTVAISQIVEHPALNETHRGTVDELAEAGYVDGKTVRIIFDTAQGSPLLASQIGQKFVGLGPEVMVGIGTTAAQTLSIANEDAQIPIVFSSVTDPVGAQFVQKLENPEGVITGVSNWIDMKPQMALFKEILPDMKKIGVVYNPGEENSESSLKTIRRAGDEMGIGLVTVSATDSAEVSQAARSLVGKVDAVFISNDNTALSAFESVVKAGTEGGIPVFVSDTDMVVRGAVAALGPNQYDIGRQTGKLVIRILEGEKPSTLPVGFPEKMELYVNLEASREIKLGLPESVLNRAARRVSVEGTL